MYESRGNQSYIYCLFVGKYIKLSPYKFYRPFAFEIFVGNTLKMYMLFEMLKNIDFSLAEIVFIYKIRLFVLLAIHKKNIY